MPPTELNLSKQISANLHTSNHSITATIQRSASGEYYTGEYVVIPSVQEQSLETKNKVMSNNVKIEEIPYFETSNERGGFTVIIG